MTERIVAMLGRGLLDVDTPVLYADDLGFTRGDGCFEGLRVQTDQNGVSTVDKLDAHLSRMTHSAAALDIPMDLARWRELITLAIDAWTVPGEAGLRLFLTRGRRPDGPPTGLLSIAPTPASHLTQRQSGISVITLNRGTTFDAFSDAPWLLGGIKTLSYAMNMAAQREATAQGADDAILVSADGWVLESPTGSVVWSHGHTLATTPTGPSGILGGTTQQLLFDRAAELGWQTEVCGLPASRLADIEGLWLIGSVRGPVEVTRVDGHQRDRTMATTAELQQLAGF